MLENRRYRTIALVVGGASLSALACLCGALGNLTQVAQDAQAVATEAVAISTQAAGVAPPVGEGDVPLPEGAPVGLPGGDLDACALVTDAEAEAVIGGAIANTVTGGGTCLREGETGRDVSLVVLPTGSEDAAQLAFLPVKQAAQEAGGSEEVSGPWAEGIWEPTDTGTLYIRQGGYVLFVSTDDPATYPDAREQSIQLATLAVGRLP